MKPTQEQIEQWQDHVDGGKDDRLFTHTQDWLTEFAELAYRAGAEKGKAEYEFLDAAINATMKGGTSC